MTKIQNIIISIVLGFVLCGVTICGILLANPTLKAANEDEIFALIETNYARSDFTITQGNASYPWECTANKEITSGNKGAHNTTSTLTISYNASVGDEISFQYASSGESCCDYLTVTINGSAYETLKNGSSTLTYKTYSTTVTTAGTWTAAFAFRKDGSASSGLDAGFVRNIRIVAPVREIAVAPSDETMGSVTGGGTFDMGVQNTISATANDGYAFVGWSLNGSTDYILENPYTFIVTTNATYTAVFKVGYNIYFKSEGGSVTKTGGAYDTNEEDTIIAYGQSGKVFMYWEVQSTGERIAANPLTITATSNETYTAIFGERALKGVSVSATYGGAVRMYGVQDLDLLLDDALINFETYAVVKGYHLDHWEDMDGNVLGTTKKIQLTKAQVKDNIIKAVFTNT